MSYDRRPGVASFRRLTEDAEVLGILVATARAPRGQATCWWEGPAWLLGYAVVAYLIGAALLPILS